MNDSDLSVCVVNWNRAAELEHLLADLRYQTHAADELIVVDNGSSDGSAEMVERDFPDVRLIRLHRNMGLSFGRNVGILAAKGDLIAILDNDLRILDRQFLAKILRSAIRHFDSGVISFHCVEGVWSHSGAHFHSGVLSFDQLEAFAEAGQSPVSPQAFYDWFFFGGACIIRRNVFETVGLFDDAFSYGGEEWDFAYRCHAAGIRMLRDTDTWVVHVRSPNMRATYMPSLILKNMVIAQSRYMPRFDLALFLLLQFGRSAVDAVKGKRVWAFLAVCWQIIREWRSQVAQQRRPVSSEVMRRFYYLRTHQTESYADIEGADTTAFHFYRHRLQNRKVDVGRTAQFAYMANLADR